MSLITDTWRQLVRRRLWPVAVLLLGALVAVPVLLAKSPAAVPPAPAPAKETAAPAGGGLEGDPVVTVADASTSRRHVLGTRKDPFEPTAMPTPTPTSTSTSSGPGGTTTNTQNGGSFTLGGGSSPDTTTPAVSVGNGGGSLPGTSGGGVSPTTPITTPTTPSAPKKKKLAPGTLTVRFGDASSDTLDKLTVKPLDALPDADQPVAIYLGPGKAKGSAVFLVDATVTPEGDASCQPSESDCQQVELRKGDTEFFTVADSSDDTTGDATTGTDTTTAPSQQFELRLVDVAGSGRAKASRARGARAAHAHSSHARVTVARVVRLLHP